MQELMLLENPGGDLKSEAMSLAGQYRSEGYDASTALSRAWDEVRGYGGYEEPAPRRRRHNPVSQKTGLTTVALLGGLAYAGWCIYYWKKVGTWSFAPWQTARRIEGQRRLFLQNQHEAAVEKSLIIPNSVGDLYYTRPGGGIGNQDGVSISIDVDSDEALARILHTERIAKRRAEFGTGTIGLAETIPNPRRPDSYKESTGVIIP